MSGHSKWKNIMHKKEKTDAQRAKIFTKIGKEMSVEDMMKRLKIASIETHVADARTCCLHPASATHRQMNDEELLAAGVSGDLRCPGI